MKVIFDNLREYILAKDCFELEEPFVAKVLRLDFSRDFGRPNEFNATGEMTPADQRIAEQIIKDNVSPMGSDW